MRISSLFLATIAASLWGQLAPLPQTLPPQEARAIAERAYIFAYPIVLMEYTRRAASERGSLGGIADPNRFMHAAAFPDAKFRSVIRPNADTLYSSAWLDLTKEPLILHVPDTHDRYYLMQFMDAWTETFDVPGKRTTGTGELYFAICGPGWKGALPERARRIDAPTNMVWLLGRTQTNGAADYENVRAIQRGYLLMPLSLYPDGPKPAEQHFQRTPRGAEAGTPPQQVEKLTAAEFFNTFAQLLSANPPHAGDLPMMKELARIGIAEGQPFHPESLPPEVVKAIDEGVEGVVKRLASSGAGVGAAAGRAGPTGWTGGGTKVGRYGTDYRARAVVARFGLGANPPEDAVYMHCQQDASGNPLDGASKYRLHFEAHQTPPVRAFWSVTMYSEDGYFIANPISRFAIGDRDPLKYNADGSLDVYIQRDAPGGGNDVNWLPAPAARFNLSLRMYWPKEEVLGGKWTPPAVARY